MKKLYLKQQISLETRTTTELQMKVFELISMFLGKHYNNSHKHVAVVQSLWPAQLFAAPWTVAHQAPLSSTISWSLLKFTSISLQVTRNKYGVATILGTWYFIRTAYQDKTSKQLFYLILFAPPENWFCLVSPSSMHIVCAGTICMMHQNSKSVQRCVWFILEG